MSDSSAYAVRVSSEHNLESVRALDYALPRKTLLLADVTLALHWL
jgi:hypothetical protein